MCAIIGYTFCGDMHCPDCTKTALEMGWIAKHGNVQPHDMHGIPESLIAMDGSPVAPIFSTDEQLGIPYCGDCRANL